MHIKKKDKVIVLIGKDRGKTGDVLKIFPGKRTAVVSKINFVKKHTKPTQTDSGGIREKEAPLPLSRLMLVCPKCDKPTRQKWEVLPEGKKTRICKKCGEMII